MSSQRQQRGSDQAVERDQDRHFEGGNKGHRQRRGRGHEHQRDSVNDQIKPNDARVEEKPVQEKVEKRQEYGAKRDLSDERPIGKQQSKQLPAEKEFPDQPLDLCPCGKCSRTFTTDRVGKHQSVCIAREAKRKLFDSRKQRLSGHENDLTTMAKIRSTLSNVAGGVGRFLWTNTWRHNSSSFRSAIHFAKKRQSTNQSSPKKFEVLEGTRRERAREAAMKHPTNIKEWGQQILEKVGLGNNKGSSSSFEVKQPQAPVRSGPANIAELGQEIKEQVGLDVKKGADKGPVNIEEFGEHVLQQTGFALADGGKKQLKDEDALKGKKTLVDERPAGVAAAPRAK